jgi:hypothetical protein
VFYPAQKRGFIFIFGENNYTMIEQNLKALDRLGGSRTMIKYVGGLPNIKSNVTGSRQPERDGVIIINSITGKTLFRIEKADIISIENDLEKSMYFNTYYICFFYN